MENLTALIPYRNGQATIDRLLDSLPKRLPVVIIDDGSDVPYASSRKNVLVLRLKARGYFAGAVNAGLAATVTDVLVLNQDVWLEGQAWQTLVQEWQANGCGIAGDAVAKHPAFPNGYVQGTFMFLSRAAINALGAQVLDETHYPLWGCTALAQLRLCRLGWSAAPVPMAAYGMRHARGSKPYGTSIAATLHAEPAKQNLYVRTPPAVSVIITSYNYGRYLGDAVHSLIGGQTSLGVFPPQTFQSFEIVIVDDGSTDETATIAQALADAWKGIRYLRLPANVGSAAAMNVGIQNSYGKYLAPLDADDMMESARLETLYRAAVENPHRVIYDDITAFANNKGALDIIHPEATKRPATVARAEMWVASYNMPDYNFEEILVKNGMHKGIFFERSAWKEVGGYPENFKDGREDWALNVALGAQGYCGVHVKAPLYLGRRHDANRTNTNGRREWRQYFIDRMHAQYPRLYAGERTPMCCGKKSNGNGNGNGAAHSMAAARAQTAGRFAMADIGNTGMVKLHFMLNKAGTVPYVGPVTNKTYVFGGQRKVAYVDARDAEGLLKLTEARVNVFERYIEREPQTDTAEQVAVPPVEEALPAETWNAKAEIQGSPQAAVMEQYRADRDLVLGDLLETPTKKKTSTRAKPKPTAKKPKSSQRA